MEKNSFALTEKESEAWNLAKEVHDGQKRYSGRPYMDHVKEVVEILRSMDVYDEDLTIVAILHDVLEDCDKENFTKYMDQISKQFGIVILSKVLMLTHAKMDKRDYQTYVDDIVKEKSKVVLVKIADMLQNMTETPTVKQREKYRIAFPKLLMVLTESHKWKK